MKRSREQHMLEAKKSSVRQYFASTSRERPSHEVPAKLSAWRILSVTFLSFIYTIYTLITHKSEEEAIQIEKNLDMFLQHNTTHPPFRERATHPLVRNHYSLFSFPLPLSYLERRFVLKHNSHFFKMQRVFWSLGNFGDLPKEAGEA